MKTQSEMEMTDEEIDRRVLSDLIESEKQKKWYVCSIRGARAFLPDCTDYLGYDVYDVLKYPHEVPAPTLMVWAYPIEYLQWDSQVLRDKFRRQLPYGDIDHTQFAMESGIIEGNEVRRKD